MPHDQCPPSRRGHAWQAVPSLPEETIRELLKHLKQFALVELRCCARCATLGRVDSQGRIRVVDTSQALPSWQVRVAAITIKLGRDYHLADSDLAKKGGPDATLACAKCGRALWMHATRHDTCEQFCWVTYRALTKNLVRRLSEVADLPEMIQKACALAFDLRWGWDVINDARRTCAVTINSAKRATMKNS